MSLQAYGKVCAFVWAAAYRHHQFINNEQINEATILTFATNIKMQNSNNYNETIKKNSLKL